MSKSNNREEQLVEGSDIKVTDSKDSILDRSDGFNITIHETRLGKLSLD